jgi:hypothetical protein
MRGLFDSAFVPITAFVWNPARQIPQAAEVAQQSDASDDSAPSIAQASGDAFRPG